MNHPFHSYLSRNLADLMRKRSVVVFYDTRREFISVDTAHETGHVCPLPSLLQGLGGSLADRIASWKSRVTETEQQLAEQPCEIDDIAVRLNGIEGEDRRAIEATTASPLARSVVEEHNEEDDA